MASADRDALEALCRSTGGISWKTGGNWATNANLSEWKGVVVDEDGRVVELLRGFNRLEGIIPEAVGALTDLTKLHLFHNKLTGPIPEAMGALTNLTELDLNNNQLTGPIPEVLGALTNLKSLDLSSNQLTGPIPVALGALTNLTELDLNNNQLTGTVPLSVWELPRTTYVGLSNNLLTHFTDPEEKSASSRVVLGCMERLGPFRVPANPAEGVSGLSISRNPLEFPPAAVVANGLENIRKYYDTWEQCGFSLEEIHALKVVFVGAYGAGKTSLARSIKMGRGDRTPETDENKRSTVGVDLHSHELRNGTECKIYDVAGQITYYGLHQFFLTERAVYVIVSDVTKFEGLNGKDLDQAVEDNILEWVSLLHMRTPLCTVMLVASHFDMLDGSPEDNVLLLATVEERFLELHEEWKSLRDDQKSGMDERMTILPGVFPVGCTRESESASCTAVDGLQAVDEALSKQKSMATHVPPSWVAARQVLEQIGSTHDGSSGDTIAMDGRRRRPWELRSVIHAKFKTFVEEGRKNAPQEERQQDPASSDLSLLDENGIRDSMEGAIELRAFSGTVISHDVFVVLDVMWLAGVLKPILDHRGVTENKKREQVFADRELSTVTLLTWANELVDRGILRKGFARFLWGLQEQATEGVDDPHEMDPAKFEEILEEIGVTIPLPEPPSRASVDERAGNSASVAAETKATGDGDGVDLLVIMRLPLEADAETRRNLLSAREAAFPDNSGGESGLKAVFKFDHAGAPYGLPERVMALSHKIGMFCPLARWRLGGLFLLHSNDIDGTSSMILEYDKNSKTFGIEVLGQTTVHMRAMGFVISALFHVARDFPGAGWTGWMECGMRHDGEKMYHLATSNEQQNQRPGSRIIPLIRNSLREEWSEQRSVCRRRGLDRKGLCNVDQGRFGKVLDVKQPYPPQEVPDRPQGDEKRPRCREAFDFVFQPLSGKIASASVTSAITFFVAATATDAEKRITLRVCYGFAVFSLLIFVVAAVVFAREKIAKGRERRQNRANRSNQTDLSSPV